MPIGSSKLGVLGAGLVPGGSVTFNTSGNWSVPPGVKKVSITGRGGTGNPGNAGNPGNPGNNGTGAGGGGGGLGLGFGFLGYADGRPGGGAFKTFFTPRPGPEGPNNRLFVAPNTAFPQEQQCGGNPTSVPSTTPITPVMSLGGTAARFQPQPNSPSCQIVFAQGSSGQGGISGNAGSAGNSGNPGNAGQASSGLGNNFPGGAGGNAGVAGNAGTGGSGGGGGSGGNGADPTVPNTVNAPIPGKPVGTYSPIPTRNGGTGGAGGTGGGAGGNGLAPPHTGPRTPAQPCSSFALSGSYGGGGAGSTNSGQAGLNDLGGFLNPPSGPEAPLITPLSGNWQRSAIGGSGNVTAPLLLSSLSQPVNQPGTSIDRARPGSGISSSTMGGFGGVNTPRAPCIGPNHIGGGAAILLAGNTASMKPGNPGVCDRRWNATPPFPATCAGLLTLRADQSLFSPDSTNPTFNDVLRSGGGGGSAVGCTLRTPFNTRYASGGGGGGGGRGNAGNAGGSSSTPTGAAATPQTFNCVTVTPGSTTPIVVASPGGQVVISWNPQ